MRCAFLFQGKPHVAAAYNEPVRQLTLTANSERNMARKGRRASLQLAARDVCAHWICVQSHLRNLVGQDAHKNVLLNLDRGIPKIDWILRWPIGEQTR